MTECFNPVLNPSLFRGCLLGGAVGDALGAPVEFMSLAEIRGRYGPSGIQDYDQAYGLRGAVTDDTQMTLFTAEGLLIASARLGLDMTTAVYHAYLRWLATQNPGESPRLLDRYGTCVMVDGFLSGIPEMHGRRAPGNTCLAALQSGVMGTPEKPINDSKGCGGVMRVAPVGLLLGPERAFETGCRMAAITHGHPCGYLASGCYAQMISDIVRRGCDIAQAAKRALQTLSRHRRHEECTAAIEHALDLAAAGVSGAESIETLGRGWVAEEALAIGICCAVAAGPDMDAGLQMAANHGGDSDSTASIAGGLMGAWLGDGAIPGRFLDELELREWIRELADDLFERCEGHEFPA